MNRTARSRGRPPKFETAGRPVTTTLPDRTLQELEAIDTDRARAIVKAAAMAVRSHSKEAILVHLIEVFRGYAVILVGPSKSLRRIGWLHMVEIAPARFLLVVPTGTALEKLEVAITDLLGTLTSGETYERKLLTELHHVLSHRRRKQSVSKAEILLLNIG